MCPMKSPIVRLLYEVNEKGDQFPADDQRTAALMSLIQPFRLNDHDPYTYLKEGCADATATESGERDS